MGLLESVECIFCILDVGVDRGGGAVTVNDFSIALQRFCRWCRLSVVVKQAG